MSTDILTICAQFMGASQSHKMAKMIPAFYRASIDEMISMSLVTKEMLMNVNIVGQHPHILDKFRGYGQTENEDGYEESCLMVAGHTVKTIFEDGENGVYAKYVANLVDWILSKDDIQEYAEIMRYMKCMVKTYPSRSVITLCYFDAIDEVDRWAGKIHHVTTFARIYDSVLMAFFRNVHTWGFIKDAAGDRSEEEMVRLAKKAGFQYIDQVEYEMRR